MKLHHNVPLSGYTSLHAGGPAASLLELQTGDDLPQILKTAAQPVWVLGYGTNILVSDKGLPGTVIINRVGQIEVGNDGLVKASSGANWDELVQRAIASNLWGLEFTSGIPGGVGAAVVGNIAAYGHQISDCLVEATLFDSRGGTFLRWSAADFNFHYRSSDLQKPENNNLVILEAGFSLSQSPTNQLEYESALKAAADLGLKPDSLSNRRQIILEARRRAGSLLQRDDGHWTAGSFFKNPLVDESQIQAIISHEEGSVNREQLLRQNVIHGGDQARVSAAHVLLAAGFQRGQTWGNVRLHPEHILKIENTSSASAQEIYDVVRNIIGTVRQKLDINLEPEVRFIGEFNG